MSEVYSYIQETVWSSSEVKAIERLQKKLERLEEKFDNMVDTLNKKT